MHYNKNKYKKIKDRHAHIFKKKKNSWAFYKPKDTVVLENREVPPKYPNFILVLVLRLSFYIPKYFKLFIYIVMYGIIYTSISFNLFRIFF